MAEVAAAAAGAGTSAPSAASVTVKRSPSEFLKSVIGRPVLVRLTTGADYRGGGLGLGVFLLYLDGILVCLDGFMNIALEQAEEWTDGVLQQKYGDCFIRGNNVLYVSSVKKR